MNQNSARRFLLINPNTNTMTTERLTATLRPQLPAGVRMDVVTARFGGHYIACEATHAVASHACLDAWAGHRAQQPERLDGVLIGCFGDPGLFALREVSGCPVTGLAEASFMQAAAHGPFAIVTGGERWKPMLHRLADSLGHGPMLRHVETVAPSGAALQADPDMALRCLGEACRQAARDGVRSIILGGAGLAGYAQALQPHVSLPLIDSALAGLEVMLGGQARPAQDDGPYPVARRLPAGLAQASQGHVRVGLQRRTAG
ncbi:MAG: aspartate/glutamate racemase family protein, partial [Limnohabitans sp.]